jgi:hypothetical protein
MLTHRVDASAASSSLRGGASDVVWLDGVLKSVLRGPCAPLLADFHAQLLLQAVVTAEQWLSLWPSDKLAFPAGLRSVLDASLQSESAVTGVYRFHRRSSFLHSVDIRPPLREVCTCLLSRCDFCFWCTYATFVACPESFFFALTLAALTCTCSRRWAAGWRRRAE